jgi:hypothetical protein
VQLMFFWLKASDAAPKIATSVAPAATADSKPWACAAAAGDEAERWREAVSGSVRVHGVRETHLEVRSQHRVRNPGRAVNGRQHRGVVAHLWEQNSIFQRRSLSPKRVT